MTEHSNDESSRCTGCRKNRSAITVLPFFNSTNSLSSCEGRGYIQSFVGVACAKVISGRVNVNARRTQGSERFIFLTSRRFTERRFNAAVFRDADFAAAETRL
jgi:hypothetical protein